MLRTIAAAGLIVTALIAGPAAAQPSDGTNSTPTTMTKHPGIRSSTKSTSRLKQTNTPKTEKVGKHAGKPIVHRRPRHHVVHQRAISHRHLVGRHRTLSPHRHPAASMADQRTQSNGSHKASKAESNANAQK
jgi:hypothetical protein